MRSAALFLLLTASAAAQSGGAPPGGTVADTTLTDVTVTASREPVTTRAAPVRVTVIDRRALDATASTSVADALQARAPVHVRRYGPSGLASVTIRGAGSSQTLVLLDGQRLTDPALGQTDLSLLPAALLDGIDVLSGPASGLYGSDAVGGVIGLKTPSATRFVTEAGPWGERRVSGVAAATVGALRVTGAAEIGQAKDDYTFRDLGRIDERRVARQGWDARRTSGYSALAWDGGATTAGASVWLADAERGLGGAVTPEGDAVGARQWDRRLRVGGRAAHVGDGFRVETDGHVQATRLRYAAPFPSTRVDAVDDTGQTQSGALDLRAGRAVGDGWWTASLSGGTGRAEHPDLAESATDRFAAVAVSGQQPVGAVTLFPALRADVYAPSGGDRRLAVAPQLGANWAVGDGWHLKASTARAFRMPTLNDRFWMPGGNPDLRPETAWSGDLGVVWTRGATQAEATAFASSARDQIVWSPTALGFWAPRNVASTRTLGLEASAQTARAVRLLGRAGLATGGAVATLTDARDLDLNRPLRYVPRWTVKAWGGVAVGAIRLDLNARWTGARYVNATASQSLPPHLLVGGHVSVQRRIGGADLRLGIVADNLTGLDYQIVNSYPMPPRHARLRLVLSPR